MQKYNNAAGDAVCRGQPGVRGLRLGPDLGRASGRSRPKVRGALLCARGRDADARRARSRDATAPGLYVRVSLQRLDLPRGGLVRVCLRLRFMVAVS